MSLTWPFKDPDEVLDYQIDWSARLADDTIATSQFILPTGSLTADSTTNTTTSTTVWLSGGDLGETYEIVNRVTTVGERTMDQTVKLRVKAK